MTAKLRAVWVSRTRFWVPVRAGVLRVNDEVMYGGNTYRLVDVHVDADDDHYRDLTMDGISYDADPTLRVTMHKLDYIAKMCPALYTDRDQDYVLSKERLRL